VALVIVAVLFFHPTTNSLLSGIVQALLYFAILAPLFWVPRLQIDLAVFRRIVVILWGFHTLSAGLGVVQTYLPGQFQPTLSSVIGSQDVGYIESLRVTTARGERGFRPMGLTDIPGGAATSGFFAVLLGIGLLVTGGGWLLKLACVTSMMLGMTSIYLSQVRSVLVLVTVATLAFAVMLVWRGRLARLGVLATSGAAVIVGSFTLAVALGGESVTSRFNTLFEGSAAEVYQSNRGRFLTQTIDKLLPRYPLGAGMGRWGMANTYFGDTQIRTGRTFGWKYNGLAGCWTAVCL
jgi:hypothetical protein